MKEDILKSLAKDFFACDDVDIFRLPGAGSNRVYYRLSCRTTNKTAIGVVGNDLRENQAFVYLANHFRSRNINVPEVLNVSADGMCYLQEDLGDVQLFSILHTDSGQSFVRQAVENLPVLQFVNGIDYSNCYPVECFDKQQVMWDLNYFKYCFLKPTGVVFDESGLENDFEHFTEVLLSVPRSMWGFLYRDCQSRNVMIHDDKPYWIDFQSGRFGPCLYDLVSFLWQAKARFSDDFRSEMVDCYLGVCRDLNVAINETEFRKSLPQYVLFRTLQVLGAYGFRGLIERKAHFIESIPFAIENLKTLLLSGIADAYPTMKKVLLQLTENEKFKIKSGDNQLTVSVFSFSYKKGYPEDLSGNGGGFMFDCRAMHNPGRYDEYKQLTGLDKPVVDFLEQQGKIQPFLKSAWQMTDPAVERYLKRGFSSLQIGFGCTGGRHRSVYSAEATARHIATKFPEAKVKLVHREQNIVRIFEKGELQ